MINIIFSNAKKNLDKLVSSCIKYNEVFTISTKDGNVVMLSEDDYKSLIESLYLANIPGVYNDIKRVNKTPISEFSREKLN